LAVDDLPLLPSGKVDRGALIRRAASAAGTVPRPGDKPYVPPRDATEEALVEIWSQLLGVERVGARDDFTALGGHSLLAVRLMAQIEQRFEVKLPLATLLRESTVEQLARVIGGPSTPEEFSPLVPFQPSGSRRPFFCVHPGGGHVLCYFELARRLGDDQPFYGFQALGSDGGDAFDPDVPAMATRYCAAMRTVQPQGPYCLGGWSIGGVVAFEMAQQLRADGEDVALLALIDSAPPAPLPPAAVADATAGLAAFARDLGLPDPDLAGEDGPQQPLDEHLRAILAQARQAGFLPSEIDLRRLRHLYRLFRNNLRAMAAYEPRPYDGRIVLFRARERPVEAAADPGWGVLARGGLRLYAIPGDHFTMVREPQVAVLARQLGSDLRDSDC
ncbi:MAG: non-ribosomal peptide synthetase, partial [bacterium]|nr:non-ribosomal peptide synthetase [bacterium]